MAFLFVLVLILAVVGSLAWLALTRKRDVSVSFKMPGANFHLEAKGDSRRR